MRILAVDYGDRRIGLAISDPDGSFALPLKVLNNPGGPEAAARSVAAIAIEQEAELIVVGLPFNMNGSEGPRAALTRQFSAALIRLSRAVELFDERLSSQEAERLLIEADLPRKKRKAANDKLAAAVILRDFLQWRASEKIKGN